MGRFDDIFDPDFYPGSKQRRRPASGSFYGPPTPSPFEGVTPQVFTVSGKSMEFFTIGQLAAALERRPVTIRKWEADGVIPRATYQAPNPKRDPRARRRLYSRAQAEGIVRIAREEHVVPTPSHVVVMISKTRFTERVIALFKELREAQ